VRAASLAACPLYLTPSGLTGNSSTEPPDCLQLMWWTAPAPGEFKWCSDISIDVTYDRHRNQLARVVENALCFQGGERFPNRVHVTLVTPAVFLDRSIRSRLYQYKFPEYDKCHDQLIAEFNACRLSKRDEDSFRYPDLTQRITCLHLHWVSFQSLREAAPDSPIKAPFQEFASRFDGTGH
jgi:hypothetical protein